VAAKSPALGNMCRMGQIRPSVVREDMALHLLRLIHH